jgi:hypothetical protein
MPAVEPAAAEPPDPPCELAVDPSCEYEADGADAEGDGLAPDPPPQPAAASATVASTATTAATGPDLRIDPFEPLGRRANAWWADIWVSFLEMSGPGEWSTSARR